MIRVLIAEDEPPIARQITRMIEELSPVFKVVACVSNGQDALTFMRDDPVDMVFTDIRMPLIDGLELLKTLRTEWPDCVTVILSGHQDFAYTQTALRLGAFDYLLKPISREKMLELLNRLEDVQAKNLLLEAVGSWRAGGKIPSGEASLPMDVTYSLIMAVAGHCPGITDDALSPGAVFWQANDPDFLIRNLLGRSTGVITFVGRAASERIFLLESTPSDDIIALTEKMFSHLVQLTGLPMTLCVVKEQVSYKDITSCIRAARGRVYSGNLLCRSALLSENRQEAIFSLSPDRLTEALLARNEKEIRSAVEQVVDAAVSGSVTQVAFEHFFEKVIHDKRLTFETKPLREELSEAIAATASQSGLAADVAQIFCSYVLGESKVELKSRIERIEQYLSTRYMEEISSDTLSAMFGFVPSYLSKVFRQQTGVSPTEYLTKLRVEKAKELLETKPGLLIREVAALVGYKDQYYFSKLFKKSTGLWPTLYQEEILSKSQP